MKKPTIKGYEAILAFIYDEDNPPFVIITPGNNYYVPYCLHSLRSGNLEHSENFFRAVADSSGVEIEKEDEYWITVYRDPSRFPEQSFSCSGCAALPDSDTHKIKDSEERCTKLCEELA